MDARNHIDSLVVVSSSSVYADVKGRSLDEAAETGFSVSSADDRRNGNVKAGSETYSTLKVAMENVLGIKLANDHLAALRNTADILANSGL